MKGRCHTPVRDCIQACQASGVSRSVRACSAGSAIVCSRWALASNKGRAPWSPLRVAKAGRRSSGKTTGWPRVPSCAVARKRASGVVFEVCIIRARSWVVRSGISAGTIIKRPCPCAAALRSEADRPLAASGMVTICTGKSCTTFWRAVSSTRKVMTTIGWAASATKAVRRSKGTPSITDKSLSVPRMRDEEPAAGITMVRSDILPPLISVEAGGFTPPAPPWSICTSVKG